MSPPIDRNPGSIERWSVPALVGLVLVALGNLALALTPWFGLDQMAHARDWISRATLDPMVDRLVLHFAASILLMLIAASLLLLQVRSNTRLLQRQEGQEATERHTQTLLNQLFEHAFDPVLICDERGYLLKANVASGRLFDYPQDELTTLTLDALLRLPHASGPHGLLHHLLNDAAHPEDGANGHEVAGVTKDGKQLRLRYQLSELHTQEARQILLLLHDTSTTQALTTQLHDQTEQMRLLCQIAAQRCSNIEQRLDQALALASAHLDLPIALVSRIRKGSFEVRNIVAPHDFALARQARLPLSETYCALTLDEGGLVVITDASQSHSDHLCLRQYGLLGYIGIPYRVRDHIQGTLCFASPQPIDPLSVTECEFVRLLADWIGATLENERANAELFGSEARLQSSQRFAKVGTWEWNLNTNEVYWSEGIATLLGVKGGVQVSSYDTFLAAVHPDDRPGVLEAVERSLANAEPYCAEFRVVWPDGTVHWLSAHGEIKRRPDGVAETLLGLVQEVTRRKEIELQLQESQTRLLEAQGLARVGHWDVDLVHGTVVCSALVHEIYGLDSAASPLRLEAFLQRVPDTERGYVEQKVAEALERGSYDVKHRILHPDGTTLTVHELANVEYDEAGTAVRLIGMLQDITALTEAEAALTANEEKYRGLFEHSPVGIALSDLQGHLVEVNSALQRCVGYNREELLEMNLWELTPSEYDTLEQYQLQALEQEGTSSPYEKELLHKNGQRIPVLAQGQLFIDQQGRRRVWSLIQDITPQKAALEALREAKESAERVSRAKSEFLSAMSHELRTPMHAILGFGQLLEGDETLDLEQQENIAEIMQASRHLLKLINEVLDLARIESGRLVLTLEPLELEEVVQNALSLAAPFAEQRQVLLRPLPNTHTLVRADTNRLLQVVLNLINNAIKYNRPHGTVTLSVSTLDHSTVRLVVRDTGIGIPALRLGELFQPFSRLDAAKSGEEGTGIGLVVCKRLTELMGGGIGVESEPDEGSRFWVDLPCFSATESAHEQSTATEERGHDGRFTLLYIEDNPANLRLVSHVISPLRHLRLLATHSPTIGLTLAEEQRPDLILLDINMPEMDGYQLLAKLQASRWGREIPVIAVTASAMPEDIVRGKEAGFRAYLTKPLDVPRFLSTIEETLHHSKGRVDV